MDGRVGNAEGVLIRSKWRRENELKKKKEKKKREKKKRRIK